MNQSISSSKTESVEIEIPLFPIAHHRFFNQKKLIIDRGFYDFLPFFYPFRRSLFLLLYLLSLVGVKFKERKVKIVLISIGALGSCRNIAQEIGMDWDELCFQSDLEDACSHAREQGLRPLSLVEIMMFCLSYTNSKRNELVYMGMKPREEWQGSTQYAETLLLSFKSGTACMQSRTIFPEFASFLHEEDMIAFAVA